MWPFPVAGVWVGGRVVGVVVLGRVVLGEVCWLGVVGVVVIGRVALSERQMTVRFSGRQSVWLWLRWCTTRSEVGCGGWGGWTWWGSWVQVRPRHLGPWSVMCCSTSWWACSFHALVTSGDGAAVGATGPGWSELSATAAPV